MATITTPSSDPSRMWDVPPAQHAAGDQLAEVRDLVDPHTLSPADKRAAARQMAEADPGLTGGDLARHFGEDARWGRRQAAAARPRPTGQVPTGTADSAPPAPPAADPVPEDRGRSVVTDRPAPPEAPPSAPPAPPVTPGLPPAHRAVILISVAIVAAVCAAASYVHLHDLVAAAGGGWLAVVLPIGIDGMAGAGTATLVAHHRHGGPRRTRTLATLAVALGLGASVAANVVAVDPELVDPRHVKWVLAAYPPVGLAVVVDLALAAVRAER